jgi:tetratricopeptide (TPR) repeat protein
MTRIALVLIALICAVAAPAVAATKEIPITTSSKEALALFEKGQFFLDVGRPQEANELFKKALQLDPTFAYAHFNKALSSASAPEFKQELDAAIKNGKTDGEKLLTQISQTFISNDAKKRIELSEQLVKQYPESPRAWLTLGGSQGSLNQNEAARKSFAKAVELKPDLIAGHIALGFNYLFGQPRDLKQAEVHMQKCISLAPKEAKCYENLGDVLRGMNKLEDARKQYSQALQLDPSNSVVNLKKGHVNSFLGHYQEAFADYDKGIEGAKASNRINYANYRAFTHIHAGDANAAIQDLSKLVTSAASLGVPADEAGAAKIFTLTNEATIALDKNLFDQSKNILQQLGNVQAETAKQVQDPNFARLQKANLILFEGQLAARQGDFATAKAKAEENRKLMESDNNPRKLEGYYGLLGLTALLQKEYKAAIENYKKSDLTAIYNKYHLAESLENAGQKSEAQQLYKDIAGWNFNSVDYALVRKDAIKKSTAS